MDSVRLPRKLAAILYADVAGYSRLSGEDEDSTHRRLSEYLDVIGPDAKTLTTIAQRAFFKVRQALPGARPKPEPGITIGQPQVTILPDWERAAQREPVAAAAPLLPAPAQPADERLCDPE